MAGPRQPIELIVAKGAKHLTKAEIAERRAREVKPLVDDIAAPAYLTKKQKDAFYRIADQLQRINLFGETDTDTLARYVTAEFQYEDATRKLRKLRMPEETGDADTDLKLAELFYSAEESAARLQDRYYKQAQTAAAALGLTISSRCKLQVPAKEEEPKANKFAKFTEIRRVAGDE